MEIFLIFVIVYRGTRAHSREQKYKPLVSSKVILEKLCRYPHFRKNFAK